MLGLTARTAAWSAVPRRPLFCRSCHRQIHVPTYPYQSRPSPATLEFLSRGFSISTATRQADSDRTTRSEALERQAIGRLSTNSSNGRSEGLASEGSSRRNGNGNGNGGGSSSSSSSSGSSGNPSVKKSKKPASHKPPKRRLEAASAPLRNSPSLTRGPLLQCIAHTTAEKYDLVQLGLTLRSLGVRWEEVPEGDRERAFVIGPWKGRGGGRRLARGDDLAKIETGEEEPGSIIESESSSSTMWSIDQQNAGLGMGPGVGEDDFRFGQEGEIWVFNSGNFVTWGLTEEEGMGFLRDVIRKKGANIEIRKLSAREYEVEEMDFVVDPDATTDTRGNLIVLGQPPQLSSFPHSPKLASLLVRYTLSLSLSRSSSLSVLEGRLDDHITSVSYLPRALEQSGAQPMQRKEVIRKLGELMTLRMAVNTWGGGLEETPDIYWAEPQLESYFDSIATEFEIKERIETFNRKCDYAQEIQSTLRALLTEASGHRMEVIIIVLIAVEVVLALIREGEEISHKVIDPILRVLGVSPQTHVSGRPVGAVDGGSDTERTDRVDPAPLLGVPGMMMSGSDAADRVTIERI